MKILLINTFCGVKSTGRICTEIAQKYILEGHTCKIAYGRESVYKKYKNITYRIGSNFDVNTHGVMSRITDKHGLYSKKSTKEFLKWADNYNPDVLWLHNLHGYYINYEMLFDWIKSRPSMQVKWTLHDCWAFTGHCAHFSMVQCYKWKDECNNCLQKDTYPASFILDGSKENFIRKKKAFKGVKNMTLIVPSNWLKDLVKQSFLKDYDVEVVYNTIDKAIFKPAKSDFKQKYNILDKKMILGVATDWSKRKGLDDFIKLSTMLSDEYIIVLVGLSKKQIKNLPKNIIGIERTNNINELVEIYSSADLFVNPSYEETFGLTTIEAQSCGTKAIVYKDTACEEIVNKFGGIAVNQDINELYEAILQNT